MKTFLRDACTEKRANHCLKNYRLIGINGGFVELTRSKWYNIRGDNMQAVIMLAIGALFLLCWHIWYEHGTSKQLSAHQKEWDLIKENLLVDCKDMQEQEKQSAVFNAHFEYCRKLWAVRGRFGACFPRK